MQFVFRWIARPLVGAPGTVTRQPSDLDLRLCSSIAAPTAGSQQCRSGTAIVVVRRPPLNAQRRSISSVHQVSAG